jgi:hypothetical protein
MLQPPAQRITLDEIFDHEWMLKDLPEKPLKVSFSKVFNFSKFSKVFYFLN